MRTVRSAPRIRGLVGGGLRGGWAKVWVWGCGLGGDRAGSRWRRRSALAWCVPSSTAPSKALPGCLLGGAERPVRTVARDPGLRVRQEHPPTPEKLRLG